MGPAPDGAPACAPASLGKANPSELMALCRKRGMGAVNGGMSGVAAMALQRDWARAC